jgi:hypothetical protein
VLETKVANTLAFCATTIITAVKSFPLQAQGCKIITAESAQIETQGKVFFEKISGILHLPQILPYIIQLMDHNNLSGVNKMKQKQ